MDRSRLTERLAFLAGIGTWAVIGLPAVVEAVQDPGLVTEPRWILWWAAYLAFGVGFWLVTSGRLDGWSLGAHRLVLGVQTLLAVVAIAALPGYGLTAILLIMTASHAAHVLPLPWGIGWILLQTSFLAVHNARAYDDVSATTVQTLAYLGFQAFALVMTEVALREQRGRQKLARVNAELEATQRLLEESSRARERLRISRELHDLLGHHLTALILNLDVASRVSEGAEREPLQKAHALAKLLIADVRGAVSRMREEDSLDLAEALHVLVGNVPRPRIHLHVDDDANVSDVQHAQVILRCVQEIVTNAIKHAGADHLWIRIEGDGDEIVVHAHDDGRGVATLAMGNGLAGMRERVEAVGGRLQIRTGVGAGFALDARLPRVAAA